MNETSTEAGGAGAPDPGSAGEGTSDTRSQAVGMEGLTAADYWHLAEECFVLATVAKEPEAAAKLVKTGDNYLRCAAEWFAHQMREA
jgi:hypothetical protein